MDQAIFPKQQKYTPFTYSVGFWSAAIVTGAGVIYFLVIVGALITGQMTFPPPNWLQLFGGIISFLVCPVMVVMMACLQTITPRERSAFSQISLSFTLLFAMAVTINRFVQLGVVRQSLALRETEGVIWFLAYNERSIMFALEILGWGWFLGLAMLFAALIFNGSGYHRWLRWLMVLYGLIAILSVVGHLLASPLISVGFFAWGFILYFITGLLAVHFRKLGFQSDLWRSL